MVGYQAPGSPGRLLAEGVKRLRLGGEDVEVRAHIELLEGWSAHADRDELLKFAEQALPRPKVIFTALGEPSAARFLAQRIHDFLGVRAIVPEMGDMWEVTKDGVIKTAP
ncbi:MAG TPA: MBL fold metallo-hydrolase RNA specificity domain-containing protein [Candidatus Paceibacterota bacterium]|nr:MBL fold metallo-hydrolase RNA specificity domain-containing protein [Candidatus Paceibacterota bacterium]